MNLRKLVFKLPKREEGVVMETSLEGSEGVFQRIRFHFYFGKKPFLFNKRKFVSFQGFSPAFTVLRETYRKLPESRFGVAEVLVDHENQMVIFHSFHSFPHSVNLGNGRLANVATNVLHEAIAKHLASRFPNYKVTHSNSLMRVHGRRIMEVGVLGQSKIDSMKTYAVRFSEHMRKQTAQNVQ